MIVQSENFLHRTQIEPTISALVNTCFYCLNNEIARYIYHFLESSEKILKYFVTF